MTVNGSFNHFGRALPRWFDKVALAFFLYLLTISLPMAAQKGCPFDQYAWYTSEAKEHYLKGNLELTVASFDEAFSLVPHPFGLDLEMYLKAAVQLKNDEKALRAAEALAKGGIPESYFLQFKSESWYSRFMENRESYQKEYKATYCLELREAVIALVEQDRVFNWNSNYLFRSGNYDFTLKELIEEGTKIREAFIQLTQDFGFPCEQNMGYRLSEEGNLTGWAGLYTLIRHIYQRGDKIYVDQLPQLRCQGKLAQNDPSVDDIILPAEATLESETAKFYQGIMEKRAKADQ